MRLLSAEAGISSDLLRRGALESDDDFNRVVRASQDLAARPMFIDDSPALSVAALRTRARRLKRMHGLSLLVVDYLQLLRGTGANRDQNRVQEISEITQTLKAIAKELNVPVLALSQLSRAVEIARGQAADAVGPARIGLDRAGRRRGHVRLSRRVLPLARRAQAARRPEGRALPGRVHCSGRTSWRRRTIAPR